MACCVVVVGAIDWICEVGITQRKEQQEEAEPRF